MGGGVTGGGDELSRIYTLLQKQMGNLSRDEFVLMRELFFNGNPEDDIFDKVKGFRAGTYVPPRMEDLDRKLARISKEMGTGEMAKEMAKEKPNMMTKQQSMPERLKKLLPSQKDLQKGLQKGLSSLRGLPKFSLPSAAAGFGAGLLLDNLFEDNSGMETTTYTQDEMDELKARYSPQEIISPLIDTNASGNFSDELRIESTLEDILRGSGRTISDRDRELVARTYGITNVAALSDADINTLLETIKRNQTLD